MSPIGFNKPYITGNEARYILEAVSRKHLSGNGHFTKLCHLFFEEKFSFNKCLLTTSCTDALEMSALLLDIQPGDEVIVPSFTFVTTATAFILRGAKIVFADSEINHPNIDAAKIEALVTARTKAIVVVHYAGVACEMDAILAIAKKFGLYVIEDAAQAISSFYKEKMLGTIGHLATFSFHETKNIISGEGGMLVVNHQPFEKRADIIWEKGTNRKAFFNGEVDKYGWVDLGSSFLPSEVIAAFLYAQLEKLETIQDKRKNIWNYYFENLTHLAVHGHLKLPVIHPYASNNAHMFYLELNDEKSRDALILHLKKRDINAVFHYLSLHKSPFYSEKHGDRPLPMSDHFSQCLLRLPFYYELTQNDQDRVIEGVTSFFK
jgi:dTDP-4-amino-4,6-dideoxygalactose transaminase